MNNSNLRHSTLSVAALPKQGEIRTTQLLEYTNGIFQGQMSGYPLKKNGLGVFAFDNGDFYFGEWENDQLQGEGILFFAFGGFVHGYFEKSKLHGPAFLKFSNGEIYEGYWRNGLIDGEAYNYFIDENLWLKCIYSNGKFQNLVEEGEGRAPSNVLANLSEMKSISDKHKTPENPRVKILDFKDGQQFLGAANKNKTCGLGILRRLDGKCDIGFCDDGRFVDVGRINLKDGGLYDGLLKNGKFNGRGMYYNPKDKSWFYGHFENGECKKISKQGQGKYPLQIVEQIRAQHHKKSNRYVDQIVAPNIFYVPTGYNRNEKQRKEIEWQPQKIEQMREKTFSHRKSPKLIRSLYVHEQVFKDYDDLSQRQKMRMIQSEKAMTASPNSKLYQHYLQKSANTEQDENLVKRSGNKKDGEREKRSSPIQNQMYPNQINNRGRQISPFNKSDQKSSQYYSPQKTPDQLKQMMNSQLYSSINNSKKGNKNNQQGQQQTAQPLQASKVQSDPNQNYINIQDSYDMSIEGIPYEKEERQKKSKLSQQQNNKIPAQVSGQESKFIIIDQNPAQIQSFSSPTFNQQIQQGSQQHYTQEQAQKHLQQMQSQLHSTAGGKESQDQNIPSEKKFQNTENGNRQGGDQQFYQDLPDQKPFKSNSMHNQASRPIETIGYSLSPTAYSTINEQPFQSEYKSQQSQNKDQFSQPISTFNNPVEQQQSQFLNQQSQQNRRPLSQSLHSSLQKNAQSELFNQKMPSETRLSQQISSSQSIDQNPRKLRLSQYIANNVEEPIKQLVKKAIETDNNQEFLQKYRNVLFEDDPKSTFSDYQDLVSARNKIILNKIEQNKLFSLEQAASHQDDLISFQTSIIGLQDQFISKQKRSKSLMASLQGGDLHSPVALGVDVQSQYESTYRTNIDSQRDNKFASQQSQQIISNSNFNSSNPAGLNIGAQNVRYSSQPNLQRLNLPSQLPQDQYNISQNFPPLSGKSNYSQQNYGHQTSIQSHASQSSQQQNVILDTLQSVRGPNSNYTQFKDQQMHYQSTSPSVQQYSQSPSTQAEQKKQKDVQQNNEKEIKNQVSQQFQMKRDGSPLTPKQGIIKDPSTPRKGVSPKSVRFSQEIQNQQAYTQHTQESEENLEDNKQNSAKATEMTFQQQKNNDIVPQIIIPQSPNQQQNQKNEFEQIANFMPDTPQKVNPQLHKVKDLLHHQASYISQNSQISNPKQLIRQVESFFSRQSDDQAQIDPKAKDFITKLRNNSPESQQILQTFSSLPYEQRQEYIQKQVTRQAESQIQYENYNDPIDYNQRNQQNQMRNLQHLHSRSSSLSSEGRNQNIHNDQDNNYNLRQNNNQITQNDQKPPIHRFREVYSTIISPKNTNEQSQNISRQQSGDFASNQAGQTNQQKEHLKQGEVFQRTNMHQGSVQNQQQDHKLSPNQKKSDFYINRNNQEDQDSMELQYSSQIDQNESMRQLPQRTPANTITFNPNSNQGIIQQGSYYSPDTRQANQGGSQYVAQGSIPLEKQGSQVINQTSPGLQNNLSAIESCQYSQSNLNYSQSPEQIRLTTNDQQNTNSNNNSFRQSIASNNQSNQRLISLQQQYDQQINPQNEQIMNLSNLQDKSSNSKNQFDQTLPDEVCEDFENINIGNFTERNSEDKQSQFNDQQVQQSFIGDNIRVIDRSSYQSTPDRQKVAVNKEHYAQNQNPQQNLTNQANNQTINSQNQQQQGYGQEQNLQKISSKYEDSPLDLSGFTENNNDQYQQKQNQSIQNTPPLHSQNLEKQSQQQSQRQTNPEQQQYSQFQQNQNTQIQQNVYKGIPSNEDQDSYEERRKQQQNQFSQDNSQHQENQFSNQNPQKQNKQQSPNQQMQNSNFRDSDKQQLSPQMNYNYQNQQEQQTQSEYNQNEIKSQQFNQNSKKQQSPQQKDKYSGQANEVSESSITFQQRYPENYQNLSQEKLDSSPYSSQNVRDNQHTQQIQPQNIVSQKNLQNQNSPFSEEKVFSGNNLSEINVTSNKNLNKQVSEHSNSPIISQKSQYQQNRQQQQSNDNFNDSSSPQSQQNFTQKQFQQQQQYQQQGESNMQNMSSPTSERKFQSQNIQSQEFLSNSQNQNKFQPQQTESPIITEKSKNLSQGRQITIDQSQINQSQLQSNDQNIFRDQSSPRSSQNMNAGDSQFQEQHYYQQKQLQTPIQERSLATQNSAYYQEKSQSFNTQNQRGIANSQNQTRQSVSPRTSNNLYPDQQRQNTIDQEQIYQQIAQDQINQTKLSSPFNSQSKDAQLQQQLQQHQATLNERKDQERGFKSNQSLNNEDQQKQNQIGFRQQQSPLSSQSIGDNQKQQQNVNVDYSNQQDQRDFTASSQSLRYQNLKSQQNEQSKQNQDNLQQHFEEEQEVEGDVNPQIKRSSPFNQSKSISQSHNQSDNKNFANYDSIHKQQEHSQSGVSPQKYYSDRQQDSQKALNQAQQQEYYEQQYQIGESPQQYQTPQSDISRKSVQSQQKNINQREVSPHNQSLEKNKEYINYSQQSGQLPSQQFQQQGQLSNQQSPSQRSHLSPQNQQSSQKQNSQSQIDLIRSNQSQELNQHSPSNSQHQYDSKKSIKESGQNLSQNKSLVGSPQNVSKNNQEAFQDSKQARFIQQADFQSQQEDSQYLSPQSEQRKVHIIDQSQSQFNITQQSPYQQSFNPSLQKFNTPGYDQNYSQNMINTPYTSNQVNKGASAIQENDQIQQSNQFGQKTSEKQSFSQGQQAHLVDAKDNTISNDNQYYSESGFSSPNRQSQNSNRPSNLNDQSSQKIRQNDFSSDQQKYDYSQHSQKPNVYNQQETSSEQLQQVDNPLNISSQKQDILQSDFKQSPISSNFQQKQSGQSPYNQEREHFNEQIQSNIKSQGDLQIHSQKSLSQEQYQSGSPQRQQTTSPNKININEAQQNFYSQQSGISNNNDKQQRSPQKIHSSDQQLQMIYDQRSQSPLQSNFNVQSSIKSPYVEDQQNKSSQSMQQSPYSREQVIHSQSQIQQNLLSQKDSPSKINKSPQSSNLSQDQNRHFSEQVQGQIERQTSPKYQEDKQFQQERQIVKQQPYSSSKSPQSDFNKSTHNQIQNQQSPLSKSQQLIMRDNQRQQNDQSNQGQLQDEFEDNLYFENEPVKSNLQKSSLDKSSVSANQEDDQNKDFNNYQSYEKSLQQGSPKQNLDDQQSIERQIHKQQPYSSSKSPQSQSQQYSDNQKYSSNSQKSPLQYKDQSVVQNQQGIFNQNQDEENKYLENDGGHYSQVNQSPTKSQKSSSQYMPQNTQSPQNQSSNIHDIHPISQQNIISSQEAESNLSPKFRQEQQNIQQLKGSGYSQQQDKQRISSSPNYQQRTSPQSYSQSDKDQISEQKGSINQLKNPQSAYHQQRQNASDNLLSSQGQLSEMQNKGESGQGYFNEQSPQITNFKSKQYSQDQQGSTSKSKNPSSPYSYQGQDQEEQTINFQQKIQASTENQQRSQEFNKLTSQNESQPLEYSQQIFNKSQEKNSQGQQLSPISHSQISKGSPVKQSYSQDIKTPEKVNNQMQKSSQYGERSDYSPQQSERLKQQLNQTNLSQFNLQEDQTTNFKPSSSKQFSKSQDPFQESQQISPQSNYKNQELQISGYQQNVNREAFVGSSKNLNEEFIKESQRQSRQSISPVNTPRTQNLAKQLDPSIDASASRHLQDKEYSSVLIREDVQALPLNQSIKKSQEEFVKSPNKTIYKKVGSLQSPPYSPNVSPRLKSSNVPIDQSNQSQSARTYGEQTRSSNIYSQLKKGISQDGNKMFLPEDLNKQEFFANPLYNIQSPIQLVTGIYQNQGSASKQGGGQESQNLQKMRSSSSNLQGNLSLIPNVHTTTQSVGNVSQSLTSNQIPSNNIYASQRTGSINVSPNTKANIAAYSSEGPIGFEQYANQHKKQQSQEKIPDLVDKQSSAREQRSSSPIYYQTLSPNESRNSRQIIQKQLQNLRQSQNLESGKPFREDSPRQNNDRNINFSSSQIQQKPNQVQRSRQSSEGNIQQQIIQKKGYISPVSTSRRQSQDELIKQESNSKNKLTSSFNISQQFQTIPQQQDQRFQTTYNNSYSSIPTLAYKSNSESKQIQQSQRKFSNPILQTDEVPRTNFQNLPEYLQSPQQKQQGQFSGKKLNSEKYLGSSSRRQSYEQLTNSQSNPLVQPPYAVDTDLTNVKNQQRHPSFSHSDFVFQQQTNLQAKNNFYSDKQYEPSQNYESNYNQFNDQKQQQQIQSMTTKTKISPNVSGLFSNNAKSINDMQLDFQQGSQYNLQSNLPSFQPILSPLSNSQGNFTQQRQQQNPFSQQTLLPTSPLFFDQQQQQLEGDQQHQRQVPYFQSQKSREKPIYPSSKSQDQYGQSNSKIESSNNMQISSQQNKIIDPYSIESQSNFKSNPYSDQQTYQKQSSNKEVSDQYRANYKIQEKDGMYMDRQSQLFNNGSQQSQVPFNYTVQVSDSIDKYPYSSNAIKSSTIKSPTIEENVSQKSLRDSRNQFEKKEQQNSKSNVINQSEQKDKNIQNQASTQSQYQGYYIPKKMDIPVTDILNEKSSEQISRQSQEEIFRRSSPLRNEVDKKQNIQLGQSQIPYLQNSQNQGDNQYYEGLNNQYSFDQQQQKQPEGQVQTSQQKGGQLILNNEQDKYQSQLQQNIPEQQKQKQFQQNPSQSQLSQQQLSQLPPQQEYKQQTQCEEMSFSARQQTDRQPSEQILNNPYIKYDQNLNKAEKQNQSSLSQPSPVAIQPQNESKNTLQNQISTEVKDILQLQNQFDVSDKTYKQVYPNQNQSSSDKRQVSNLNQGGIQNYYPSQLDKNEQVTNNTLRDIQQHHQQIEEPTKHATYQQQMPQENFQDSQQKQVINSQTLEKSAGQIIQSQADSQLNKLKYQANKESAYQQDNQEIYVPDRQFQYEQKDTQSGQKPSQSVQNSQHNISNQPQVSFNAPQSAQIQVGQQNNSYQEVNKAQLQGSNFFNQSQEKRTDQLTSNDSFANRQFISEQKEQGISDYMDIPQKSDMGIMNDNLNHPLSQTQVLKYSSYQSRPNLSPDNKQQSVNMSSSFQAQGPLNRSSYNKSIEFINKSGQDIASSSFENKNQIPQNNTDQIAKQQINQIYQAQSYNQPYFPTNSTSNQIGREQNYALDVTTDLNKSLQSDKKKSKSPNKFEESQSYFGEKAPLGNYSIPKTYQNKSSVFDNLSHVNNPQIKGHALNEGSFGAPKYQNTQSISSSSYQSSPPNKQQGSVNISQDVNSVNQLKCIIPLNSEDAKNREKYLHSQPNQSVEYYSTGSVNQYPSAAASNQNQQDLDNSLRSQSSPQKNAQNQQQQDYSQRQQSLPPKQLSQTYQELLQKPAFENTSEKEVNREAQTQSSKNDGKDLLKDNSQTNQAQQRLNTDQWSVDQNFQGLQVPKMLNSQSSQSNNRYTPIQTAQFNSQSFDELSEASRKPEQKINNDNISFSQLGNSQQKNNRSYSPQKQQNQGTLNQLSERDQVSASNQQMSIPSSSQKDMQDVQDLPEELRKQSKYQYHNLGVTPLPGTVNNNQQGFNSFSMDNKSLNQQNPLDDSYRTLSQNDGREPQSSSLFNPLMSANNKNQYSKNKTNDNTSQWYSQNNDSNYQTYQSPQQNQSSSSVQQQQQQEQHSFIMKPSKNAQLFSKVSEFPYQQQNTSYLVKGFEDDRTSNQNIQQQSSQSQNQQKQNDSLKNSFVESKIRASDIEEQGKQQNQGLSPLPKQNQYYPGPQYNSINNEDEVNYRTIVSHGSVSVSTQGQSAQKQYQSQRQGDISQNQSFNESPSKNIRRINQANGSQPNQIRERLDNIRNIESKIKQLSENIMTAVNESQQQIKMGEQSYDSVREESKDQVPENYEETTFRNQDFKESYKKSRAQQKQSYQNESSQNRGNQSRYNQDVEGSQVYDNAKQSHRHSPYSQMYGHSDNSTTYIPFSSPNQISPLIFPNESNQFSLYPNSSNSIPLSQAQQHKTKSAPLVPGDHRYHSQPHQMQNINLSNSSQYHNQPLQQGAQYQRQNAQIQYTPQQLQQSHIYSPIKLQQSVSASPYRQQVLIRTPVQQQTSPIQQSYQLPGQVRQVVQSTSPYGNNQKKSLSPIQSSHSAISNNQNNTPIRLVQKEVIYKTQSPIIISDHQQRSISANRLATEVLNQSINNLNQTYVSQGVSPLRNPQQDDSFIMKQSKGFNLSQSIVSPVPGTGQHIIISPIRDNYMYHSLAMSRQIPLSPNVNPLTSSIGNGNSPQVSKTPLEFIKFYTPQKQQMFRSERLHTASPEKKNLKEIEKVQQKTKTRTFLSCCKNEIADEGEVEIEQSQGNLLTLQQIKQQQLQQQKEKEDENNCNIY